MTSALYVHIPFCAHLCGYCDFAKVNYRAEWAFSYVERLLDELKGYPKGPYKTIYVGGGTPSVLPLPLLEKVLKALAPLLADGGEFTVEVNPEDGTEALFSLLARYGVNRLSFGVQSAREETLRAIGRHHTFEQAKQAVILAKAVGFTNISVDEMYGLPNETLAEAVSDAQAFLAFDVPHVSFYALTVEGGTAFHNVGIKEQEDDALAEQYEAIKRIYEQAGYHRYEVSNFAKPGYESRHNLTYWHDDPYVGIGLGAAGYHDGIRYTNTRNLSRYLSGRYRDEEEVVTREDDIQYFLLTNLRLESGFSLAEFTRRFGEDFLEKYEETIARLKARNLLEIQDGRVHVPPKNLLLLDQALREF